MLTQWLKWQIDTMGWFFELELSEPTLELYTHLLEKKLSKRYPK